MAKPNRNFDLDVKDINLIENSLREYANNKDVQVKNEINQILGKIHNQKMWYRPKGVYVSG